MLWVVNKKEKNHESLVLNRLADHKKLKDIKAQVQTSTLHILRFGLKCTLKVEKNPNKRVANPIIASIKWVLA